MIEQYVKDIRRALKDKCYFAALSLALALPDICGRAEYPNKSVNEGYTGWFDRFIGEQMARESLSGHTPYLSGEVVYNLRNTFLHQGSPVIVGEKVKERCNQMDRFILVLGDGTVIRSIAMTVNTHEAIVRTLYVDVTYLCTCICDSAEKYYAAKRDRFSFDYNIVSQSDFLKGVVSLNGFKAEEKPKEIVKPEVNGNMAQPKDKPQKASKYEHQFRCFFGQNFKEEKYKARKEEIIKVYLNSKTKTQLNTGLVRLFPGADVKIILGRLKPLTQDWPGQ